MRIGMITGEYPPLEGGVGAFTRELSTALNALGHELTILTTAIPPLPVITTDGPLTVYRQIHDWNRSAYPQINAWIRDNALDLVDIQYQAAAFQMRGWMNLYPRLHKRATGTPIVVTYHDLLPPYLFPKAGPLRKWAIHQLAQHAEGVIVTNGSDYTELTTAAGDALPPVRLIPIGSNIAPNPPDGYDRIAWRTVHNFTPGTLLIGFFGFLNRSKGIETLVDAVRLLVDDGLPAHLIFIGGRTGSSDATNARYADEIDARIARLGIAGRIHRTGFTTPPEVSAALLAADVCALPYRSGVNFRRGTLHAALAHGCAIVTTAPQIETPQLRHGENVILVPPQNPRALAAAIRDLWRQPKARQALGAQAAALAQEFSWERIAAHTAEFFRTLTQK